MRREFALKKKTKKAKKPKSRVWLDEAESRAHKTSLQNPVRGKETQDFWAGEQWGSSVRGVLGATSPAANLLRDSPKGEAPAAAWGMLPEAYEKDFGILFWRHTGLNPASKCRTKTGLG